MAMSTRSAFIEILMFVGLMSTGCAQNALFFHETTKFSFTAEYKPESSQPLNTSLGYKRRIVAVVPPKEPVSQADANNPQAVHKGEALSLVSTFDVEAKGILGATISNYFASGMAARTMTAGTDAQAAASVRSLFAPATLVKVSPDVQKRKLALQDKRRKLTDEKQIEQILREAGCESRANTKPVENLQDCIADAMDEGAVTKLEAAFGRLP